MTLLEWARTAGARYVQVSTDEVYGDLEAGGRAREDDALRPSSPYSAAKAGGDLQVLAYVRTYGVNASITRGANTYGPNQYPEKLVPLFVTNALDGQPLPVYGDGQQVREWLHAEDHCAGVELVLHEGAPGEIYNVGGEDHPNLEVTHRILELTGADAEPRPARRGSRGPRPPLRDRRREAAGARLVAGALLRRDGTARDRRLVPLEPRLVGADQVGRLPALLRGAVRSAASGVARRRRHTIRCARSRSSSRSSPCSPWRARRPPRPRSPRRDDVRPHGRRLGPRRRDEPVGRLRPGEGRARLQGDPRSLLPRHDARRRRRRARSRRCAS